MYKKFTDKHIYTSIWVYKKISFFDFGIGILFFNGFIWILSFQGSSFEQWRHKYIPLKIFSFAFNGVKLTVWIENLKTLWYWYITIW